jgi:hypothetical protein
MILTSIINTNENICGCDGSFAINAFNGTPPYSYSIDSGLTFRNTPLFTNLCPGQYTIIVQDISGNTSTNTLTLLASNNFISYEVSLITDEETIVDNGVTLTKKRATSLSITPELPTGVTITFDLIHLNTSKSSPFTGSSSSTSVSTLEKNSITQSISYSSTTSSSTYNSYPGCQDQFIYINSYTEGWANLSYTNTDNIELITITSVIKNQNIPCYFGDSVDTYSLSNVSISGCYCCNVITT